MLLTRTCASYDRATNDPPITVYLTIPISFNYVSQNVITDAIFPHETPGFMIMQRMVYRKASLSFSSLGRGYPHPHFAKNGEPVLHKTRRMRWHCRLISVVITRLGVIFRRSAPSEAAGDSRSSLIP